MEIKNNSISNKREIIQYFDLFFGLYNSFVMSFMVIIILRSLILAIIAHVFLLILIIGIIFTFLKKNPFYMVFIYGAFLCGSFYSLPGIFVIPTTNFSYGFFDYIIFGIGISEIFYLIIILKDSSFLETYGRLALIKERAQYDAGLHYVLVDPESLRMQEQKALGAELKEKHKKEEYNKKHKRSWIISICTISVVGYYIAYFSSFGL